MLANNLPYDRIEDALHARGFTISQRNISNWKTRGGYDEWRAAQAQALELRTFQDNLTDFLRRHDAAELPEVGLQSAATNLSAILLRPGLMRELLENPEKYAKLIELQCRLAREIHTLQKDRDEVSKVVGGNPERLKRQNDQDVEAIRKIYSSSCNGNAQKESVPCNNFMPKELDPVFRQTFSAQNLFDQIAALTKPQPLAPPSPSDPPSESEPK